MKNNSFEVYHAYSEGEIGWVMIYPDIEIKGEDISEKYVWLQKNYLSLFGVLLKRPRSNEYVSLNLILPSKSEKADFGLITLETAHLPPISGSNLICSITVAIETGLISSIKAKTRLNIETPIGQVEALAYCENGKCKKVTVIGVQCYIHEKNVNINIFNSMSINVDIVFSGAFFAAFDISTLNNSLELNQEVKLISLSSEIFHQIKKIRSTLSTDRNQDNEIGFVLLYNGRDSISRDLIGTIFIPPNRLDISPCGTGTMARTTLLAEKGLLGINNSITQVSRVGGRFTSKVVDILEGKDKRIYSLSLTGRAWLIGLSNFYISDDDPFPDGL